MVLLRSTLKQADMRTAVEANAYVGYVPAPTRAAPVANVAEKQQSKSVKVEALMMYQQAIEAADLPARFSERLRATKCLLAAYRGQNSELLEIAQEVSSLARQNYDEATQAVNTARHQAALSLA